MASDSHSATDVLDAAERLFLERGYAGTRLRDIADALGIKQASLYYHAPGGKGEMWKRVIDRAFERHRAGLVQAATEAGDGLRPQLIAMARWLVSQPAMNVVMLASSDVPSASQPEANETLGKIYENVMAPVRDVFREAATAGEIAQWPPDFLAGMFIATVNGLVHATHAGMLPVAPTLLAEMSVDVMLTGAQSPFDAGAAHFDDSSHLASSRTESN